jgi:predicted RNA-binding Zn ribbon-like protein
VEQIVVPFRAADAADQGRGEPSWGQRELWGVGGHEGRHVTLGGVTALPRGTSVEAVADSICGLIARHPTLRTRFTIEADQRLTEQVVAAEGEIPITLVDADDPEQAAQNTVIAFDQGKFDFAKEWPLRMAVIRHRGAATHMAAVYNHIALDARGLDAMLADLLDRNASPDGLAPPPPLQPLEQASWQLSTAGRRQSGRALRHWDRVLREAPTRHFRNQRADDDAPYLKLTLESEAARLAVNAIAERTRQSSGHILLAAYAAAAAHLAGSPIVALRVVVDNRFRPGLSDSVSTVSQMGLWSIDASAATFDTMLARALTASLDTYMNAYYDPEDRQDLIDSIGRERGQAIVLDCCYNDRRRSVQDLKPGGAVEAADASALDVTGLREALDRSVLRWHPWTAPTKPAGETLYLHVDDALTGPALVFTVCGDATYLSPTQVEECAHTIEDVLVQAALDLGAFLPARR